MRIKKPPYLSPIQSGAGVSVTSQSVNNNTNTKLNWDTETWDYDNEMDIATNNRFTCKNPGLYLATLMTYGILGANVFHQHNLLINGSDAEGQIAGQTGSASQNSIMNSLAILRLDAGDYVEGYVHHIAGAAKNIDAEMRIVKLFDAY
jgi:hypothetical protein